MYLNIKQMGLYANQMFGNIIVPLSNFRIFSDKGESIKRKYDRFKQYKINIQIFKS